MGLKWDFRNFLSMALMEEQTARHKAVEQTARHEAGHAVIAAVLRKQFRYVTINFAVLADGRKTDGHLSWLAKGSFAPKLDNEKRTRFICERNAIVQFAGHIAEGEKRRDRGGAYDFVYAEKMISHISRTRDESRANWKRLWNQAEILVSHHRASIEAVSRELLVRRRLSYRDVRKIVTPRLDQ